MLNPPRKCFKTCNFHAPPSADWACDYMSKTGACRIHTCDPDACTVWESRYPYNPREAKEYRRSKVEDVTPAIISDLADRIGYAAAIRQIAAEHNASVKIVNAILSMRRYKENKGILRGDIVENVKNNY